MNSKILRSFVIGSSPFVFIPFYIGGNFLNTLRDKRANKINLKTYAITTSLYFGLVNSLFSHLSDLYKWTPTKKALCASIFSSLFVCLFVTYYKPYDFKDTGEWLIQYLLIFVSHFATFFIIIKNMESVM